MPLRYDHRNVLNPNQTDSLRNRVYEYIHQEMVEGRLLPGASIDLNEMSRKLCVSKTPLRDALIRLEAEGMVSILPRRGIVVNRLELEDIRYLYEVIGAIEASLVTSIFHKFQDIHVARMEELNRQMKSAIMDGDFFAYDHPHWDFHNLFMEQSGNIFARRVITPIKQRLWDFPRQGFSQEWELRCCAEHQQIAEAIKRGDLAETVRIIREVHWSFAYNEKYIRKVYFPHG